MFLSSFFDKYHEMLAPVLLKDILKDHFGFANPMKHILRLQFACMNLKSSILKHADHGGWHRMAIEYMYL